MINSETLRQILPACKDPNLWASELDAAAKVFYFDTTQRLAAFIAQTAHESASYNVLQENLNYSKEGLRKVFPKYFPDDATASRYARQPKWIASRVYGNRMGNGGEQTQEGWKFRGRGLIQVTGKNNYRLCSDFLFGDDRLLEDPDILLEPEYAMASAGWFWETNKLNDVVDSGNFVQLTKRINGGTNGLAHRQELFDAALRYLE
jgi:putative chitinase